MSCSGDWADVPPLPRKGSVRRGGLGSEGVWLTRGLLVRGQLWNLSVSTAGRDLALHSGSWSECHALHKCLRRSGEEQKLFLLEDGCLWLAKDRKVHVWVRSPNSQVSLQLLEMMSRESWGSGKKKGAAIGALLLSPGSQACSLGPFREQCLPG